MGAIAGTRKEVIVKENTVNNGASTMEDPTWLNWRKSESVRSILLSDLYTEAKESSPTANVFMKVDIEGYECEAFIQSPKVLEDPALKAVVFEWLGEVRSCPEKDFLKVLSLLRKNGFQLLKFDRGSLKYDPKTISDKEMITLLGANFFWSRKYLNIKDIK